MEAWEKDETFLARWLENELTEEELQDFKSGESFSEFEKIRTETSRMELPGFDVDKGFNALKENRNQSRTKREPARIHPLRKIGAWAVAATILIAAVTSVFYFTINQSTVLQVQTVAGSIETIQLPDGTEVILNSNSLISYDEKTWLENRTLVLEGEAFFKVPSGSPFVVETQNGSVTVLGTEFNVKSRSGTFDASCYEGRIAVAIENIVEELTPGEQVRYSEDSGIENRVFEVITEPRWTSGIIEVRELPLTIAVKELQALYGISISNPEVLTDDLFSGSYPGNNLDAALRLVLEPFGFQFEYNATTKELTLFK